MKTDMDEFVFDLAMVHAAYSRIQDRLACLSQLVKAAPDIVPHILDNFSVDDNEMVWWQSLPRYNPMIIQSKQLKQSPKISPFTPHTLINYIQYSFSYDCHQQIGDYFIFQIKFCFIRNRPFSSRMHCEHAFSPSAICCSESPDTIHLLLTECAVCTGKISACQVLAVRTELLQRPKGQYFPRTDRANEVNKICIIWLTLITQIWKEL